MGSSRHTCRLRDIRPVGRSKVSATSAPSETSSYSVACSSNTAAPPAATNAEAGKVGSGSSPKPPSDVSPRSTTANWPSP